MSQPWRGRTATLTRMQILFCFILLCISTFLQDLNLIFRWDPAVSIADEIADEDDVDIDIGDDIAPDFVDQSSGKAWDETWLELEEEADTEG